MPSRTAGPLAAALLAMAMCASAAGQMIPRLTDLEYVPATAAGAEHGRAKPRPESLPRPPAWPPPAAPNGRSAEPPVALDPPRLQSPNRAVDAPHGARAEQTPRRSSGAVPRRLPPIDAVPGARRSTSGPDAATGDAAPFPGPRIRTISRPAAPRAGPPAEAEAGAPPGPRIPEEIPAGEPSALPAHEGLPEAESIDAGPVRALRDFSPTPIPAGAWHYDAQRETDVYDGKYEVPVQRPLVEWGVPFYGSGTLPPGGTFFSPANLTQPRFYAYGDYRVGVATGRNNNGRIDNGAHRLNLDLDYRLTATERFHGFLGPLNRGVQFSRIDFDDGSPRLRQFFNPNFVTGFFEGDLGAIAGGFRDAPAAFDLPVSIGLLPLLYQNGIWMEDAVAGAAVAVPSRHNRWLGWSNYDASVFAAVDRIDSPAFGADDHAAQLLGTAWFIEAYGGYIEAGWAYVRDRQLGERSYHNATLSFTRRYFHRFNNSVRVITNFGQDLPAADRTADGTLLLVETSLISHEPLTLLPYLNLFAGFDRPQSVARSVFSGGVLRNTGINFETDGLNGYPTLDASANNTLGGALGVSWLGLGFDRQVILEAAYLHAHGPQSERAARGDQYALGARLQWPLSHRTLLRADSMYGLRVDDRDVFGTRLEWRWKF